MEAIDQVLQFLINALSLGGLYALVALGLALVYSILRLVNFAYGELVMVGGYTLLVLGQVTGIPWLIVAALAIFVAVVPSLLLERVAFRPRRLTPFLRRPILGSALRAAADDFVMTRLLGIRANLVIATAFAISGCLAGVVSLFWIGRSGSVIPQIGLTPVLIAFVASVIGGMGSLGGAVAGGYLLGFLTTTLNTLLPQRMLHFL